jgi:hypothetical protein
MVIAAILISLYLYLLVKAIFIYLNFSFTRNTKWFFAEVLIFALTVGYLFNFFYFHSQNVQDLIIPRIVLWLAFILSILTLGIALGAKTALLNIRHNISLDVQDIHDTYIKIWININIALILFLFSLMEISRPLTTILELKFSITIYILSAILGLIYALVINREKGIIKKICNIVFALIIVSLFLLLYEVRSYYNPGIYIVSTSLSIILFMLLLCSFVVYLLNKMNLNYQKILFPRGISKKAVLEELQSSVSPKELKSDSYKYSQNTDNSTNLIQHKSKSKKQKDSIRINNKTSKSKKKSEKSDVVISLNNLKD